MKPKTIAAVIVATILAIVFIGRVKAQEQEDLAKVADKVSHQLQIKMPGWKHKHGEPMLGSKNVIEDFWSIPNRIVKISILPHKSANEARERLRAFVQYDREKEELNGLGDEAYTWGYGLSNIAFRRGRFTIYVGTTANVDGDADARMLSEKERGERERLEMRRLSREFTKHASNAIDLP